MKLLLCKKCSDVFALRVGTTRSCHCGQVTGQYTDIVNCIVSDRDHDDVIVIGFNNTSLVNAIRDQIHHGDTNLEDMNSMLYPGEKRGRAFEAFIIPNGSSSVVRNKP